MRWIVVCLALATPAPAQDVPRRDVVGAEPVAGRDLIAAYGCGTCHTIPGIAGARGTVGPDELAAWLVAPDAYMPMGAMPDMGVSRPEAEAMAAYLMTLRGEDPPSWPVAVWRALLAGPE